MCNRTTCLAVYVSTDGKNKSDTMTKCNWDMWDDLMKSFENVSEPEVKVLVVATAKSLASWRKMNSSLEASSSSSSSVVLCIKQQEPCQSSKLYQYYVIYSQIVRGFTRQHYFELISSACHQRIIIRPVLFLSENLGQWWEQISINLFKFYKSV